jgi:cell division protein FtsB
LGVEVASGLLIAVDAGRRGVSMAALRRLSTRTPGAIPLGALLGRRQLRTSPVRLVICDPEHLHRTLQVPPMTSGERAEVVRREITRDGGTDRVPAWRHVRRLEIDGATKDEILVVAASAERLQKALDPVLAGGVVPQSVVTGPLALIAAARALSPAPLDRPTVLVHWGTSSLTIVILSENGLKFARVIEPPASDLDPLDWIPVEIDRSVRHHAFLSKGERVEQMMVSVAEAAPARRLFTGGELATKVGLPVTNLNALLAPELPQSAHADAGVTGVEMAEGVFMLAYGAALLTPGAAPNLLPHALVVQRRSRFVQIGAVAASLLMAAALASTAALMTAHAEKLRLRLNRARADEQARQALVAENGRVEVERQQMRQLVRLLSDDPLKRLPVDDALREIARLAPGQLRLDQLTLSIDASGYGFRLVGRAESPNLADAQHTLNAFYYGLRRSPLFYDVQSLEGASLAPAAATPVEESGRGPLALPFVLTLKPKELQ